MHPYRALLQCRLVLFEVRAVPLPFRVQRLQLLLRRLPFLPQYRQLGRRRGVLILPHEQKLSIPHPHRSTFPLSLGTSSVTRDSELDSDSICLSRICVATPCWLCAVCSAPSSFSSVVTRACSWVACVRSRSSCSVVAANLPF